MRSDLRQGQHLLPQASERPLVKRRSPSLYPIVLSLLSRHPRLHTMATMARIYTLHARLQESQLISSDVLEEVVSLALGSWRCRNAVERNKVYTVYVDHLSMIGDHEFSGLAFGYQRDQSGQVCFRSRARSAVEYGLFGALVGE